MNHNKLVIDVEAILDQAKSPITDHCCIYRVPCDVREVNPDAYTPTIIAIGPLHHSDKRLQNMEIYKYVYFKQFVSRAKNKLNDLISAVKKEEPELRCCYGEILQMSSDELVKVILVDACFIVELFYKRYNNELRSDDYKMLHPVERVDMDLLLLENQVPFFILEKLYTLVFETQDHILPTFLELSINYFSGYNIQKLKSNIAIYHFTDMLRTSHLQQSMPERKEYLHKHIPTASAFNEAMGKFKLNKSECILELKFFKGCLEIPYICVDDNTETWFRNMLAFEQCHYPSNGPDRHITDYVSFMDDFINTGKDVDVLIENEILRNMLGDSDTVAQVFNSIGKNIWIDSVCQYTDLINELNDFYHNRWRQKWAALTRDYCNTPWHILATCAAIALLFLTLIQTVCSILQVV